MAKSSVEITAHFIKNLEGVSAASGLVYCGQKFYAVADDSLSLLCFSNTGLELNQISLFAGVLPEDAHERKKEKPDLESLCLLSQIKALLAVPSGSTEKRSTGVLFFIESQNKNKIDFTKLYSFLARQIGDLNIEGSLVQNEHLLLFQRGNSLHSKNAIIQLSLKILCEELLTGHLSDRSYLGYKEFNLGQHQGVGLSFTDATLDKNNQIVFLAAAEDTHSSYDDGAFAGAVVGIIDSLGQIVFQQSLLCEQKPEGLCRLEDVYYAVTDADDPQKISQFLKFNLK
jgi:hypothetical protein